ncbi:gluzincin family metallopeptidase [Mucilaginibacter sp.]
MMSTKPVILFIAIILSFLTSRAQEILPVIKGNVDISIKKGTMSCDMILSNLPNTDKYVIRLNAGMNIYYFKDVKRGPKPLFYDVDKRDSVQTDESKSYYVHENRGNPARYLPQELEVKYLGMYPVVTDSTSGYEGEDWRGNIAFNSFSIRADGFQSNWYPVLYDISTKKQYERLKYDLTITCEDCTVLFVNGSVPVKAKSAQFISDIPRELAIFCGDFETAQHNGVWLLNSGMKKEDQDKLYALAGTYQAYYSKKFDIPYKGNLTFLHAATVANPKEWGFNFYADPTTFNVADGEYSLASFFNSGNSTKNKQSMAHELAHYYFGTLLKPGAEFGHVMEEGFAEYLSFYLTFNLEGAAPYHDLLQVKFDRLQNLHHYKPFSLVKTEADYGNREYYLYYYAPVIFLAIQKEIGEQVMWRWLKAMVATKSDRTDYNLFLDTFNSSVTDPVLRKKIIGNYFTSDNALQNAKDELGEK